MLAALGPRMNSWIQRIRSLIGTELIFVNSPGGWIEDGEGRVLLQQRAASGTEWGFPGGILELGELAEEAAIREIREETGLDVVPTRLIGIYTKYFQTCPNGDQCQDITFLFHMRIVGGALHVDYKETFELKFFRAEDMPPLYSDQHRQMRLDAMAGGPAFYR